MTRGTAQLMTLASAPLLVIATVRSGQESVPPETTWRTQDARASYMYVGTKTCRMCHTKRYWSWKESPKGRSWEDLKPGVGREAKILAGLDPGADYTTDRRCLKCHSVGFGKQSGYAVPKPGDEFSARRAAALEGAGCEACHGPGSGFIQVMRDIYLNERRYRREEVEAAGRRTVGPKTCMSCHNQDAICVAHKYASGERDFARSRFERDIATGRGFHGRFPFKYRLPATGQKDTSRHANGSAVPRRLGRTPNLVATE